MWEAGALPILRSAEPSQWIWDARCAVSQCVVVGCDQESVAIAGKPTPWGAWEYRVCAVHKAVIDAGAEIQDLSDGRSITLNV